MRLINTETRQLEEFWTRSIPEYAVLSHTWGEHEVSFRDMQDFETASRMPGYAKLKMTCEKARESGYGYAWLDTSCIDKSSSAELQEAINSMYNWYANAAVCYAYLEDLPSLEDSIDRSKGERFSASHSRLAHENLARCKWFTRSWTLQELIAPKRVDFYNAAWDHVGTKSKLLDVLSSITGIGANILDHTEDLSTVSVAARMSWAAGRRSTRVEDRAYALLGIFGVNLPMLYGERSNAFRRLQEEIMRTTADQSIFAWKSGSCHRGCLLAGSPADFAGSGSVVVWGRGQSYTMTNRGLRMTVPITTERYLQAEEVLAILNCRHEGDLASTLALRLRRYPTAYDYFVRRDVGGACPHGSSLDSSHRVAAVSAEAVQVAEMTTIEISRTFEATSSHRKFWLQLQPDEQSKGTIEVLEVYPKDRWSQDRRVMRAPSYQRPRGGALLALPSGRQIVLVFGYEDDIQVRERQDKREQVAIPGILVQAPIASRTLEELCAFEYCPPHRNNRECPFWTNGHCTNTPTRIRIGNPPADLEIGWATIEERFVLDEWVFVVTVTVSDTTELEAGVSAPPQQAAAQRPDKTADGRSMRVVARRIDAGLAVSVDNQAVSSLSLEDGSEVDLGFQAGPSTNLRHDHGRY